METCGKVECRPKDRITKGEWCTSVLKVLAPDKLQSKADRTQQVNFTHVFITMILRMFSCVSSKVTPQKQLGIGTRKTGPVHWYNTNGRPAHTYLNSRHKSSVQERPLLPHEKHRLGPNELQHSNMQPVFNFCSMESPHTLTVHITPPLSCSISNCQKSNKCKSSCSCIFMKNQNQRYHHPLYTKRGLSRPGARIHQVITMVRPPCSVPRSTLFLPRCVINNHFLIFISVQQCHFFNKIY